LYDAAVRRGVRIVDVRHEQTAVFAAEAMAKLTRRIGVAALTAGPGVTNGISAVTTAQFNGSPVIVLGGRAQEATWGIGALQEFDHVPVLAPVTKWAGTARTNDAIAPTVATAARSALSAHRGPVFVDVPLDVFFAQGPVVEVEPEPVWSREADPEQVALAAALMAGAERPALVVGSDLYWDGGWAELVAAAEALRLPVFANGLGRGCIPASHELSFTATRSLLKTEADVVCVIGTPLDFRLGYGNFGAAKVIHITDAPGRAATHVALAAAPAGDLAAICAALAAHTGPRADHEPWIARLRAAESAAGAGDADALAADAVPILPARIYGELRKRLADDAVLVCDGGDYVSYAGKYLTSERPGCWLDAGPFGCLGTAMGYAVAARIARPSSQVVVLLGDGAAGFSLGDLDTLVRHALPAVIVIGNNGIWGLEKHPMQMLYGYDVAAELTPGTRYDQVCIALGGGGELVERPDDIGPALDRAFASGVPYVVNVLTDPADAYPRRSSLG
jgi:acetolactate synthase-1/2/3 large subunit